MTDLNNGEVCEGSSGCKRKAGPRFSPIWDHFIKGDSAGSGHHQATWKYCNCFFKQGRPQYLRAHILSFCPNAPKDAKRAVNQELLDIDSSPPVAKKIAVQGQKQLDGYYESATIEPSRQKEIEQALIMM